jgi:hypothetical protein
MLTRPVENIYSDWIKDLHGEVVNICNGFFIRYFELKKDHFKESADCVEIQKIINFSDKLTLAFDGFRSGVEKYLEEEISAPAIIKEKLDSGIKKHAISLVSSDDVIKYYIKEKIPPLDLIAYLDMFFHRDIFFSAPPFFCMVKMLESRYLINGKNLNKIRKVETYLKTKELSNLELHSAITEYFLIHLLRKTEARKKFIKDLSNSAEGKDVEDLIQGKFQRWLKNFETSKEEYIKESKTELPDAGGEDNEGVIFPEWRDRVHGYFFDLKDNKKALVCFAIYFERVRYDKKYQALFEPKLTDNAIRQQYKRICDKYGKTEFNPVNAKEVFENILKRDFINLRASDFSDAQSIRLLKSFRDDRIKLLVVLSILYNDECSFDDFRGSVIVNFTNLNNSGVSFPPVKVRGCWNAGFWNDEFLGFLNEDNLPVSDEASIQELNSELQAGLSRLGQLKADDKLISSIFELLVLKVFLLLRNTEYC